jgi:ribose transport system ATP-binding protein
MEQQVLFSARDITKQYPGTLALNKVSMDIHPGEVVGLVGENGAGKSTLLKIIMGIEQPTDGSMESHGKKYTPQNPLDANQNGIGMVFQEQALIQNLTVAQNIFFGREDSYMHFGILNRKKMYEDAVNVLKEMDLAHIRPDKKVNLLDFSTRQMVEIAKVFHSVKSAKSKGAIILLDEPTSVLSDSEVQHLFDHIRGICAKGNSVVFISHRLDEVLKISDRIYIFKDGCNVGIVDRKEANEALLYKKMVGKTASGEYYKVNEQREPGKETLLELRDLGLKGYFKDVNLTLHNGEVIGICGVIGSGKEDLCAVICGDEMPTSGEMLINGKKCTFKAPYQALKSGILSIPKERRTEGIISDRPVYENISMSNFDAIKTKGLISDKKGRIRAGKYVHDLSIKLPSVKQNVGYLSGGNAQKVVFARILASDANILILNHPTRGVDVGAKEEIYNIIRDITKSGKGVIVLGDTLDECIGLSNRIIVMKDGKITKEFNASPENKPEQVEIIQYMM